MIVCEFCPPDSRSREESFTSSSQASSEFEHESSGSKLAALKALGAVGLQIVHYSYEESKFRVQVIGAPNGLCVDLSSQEYFRFSQAMDDQSEPEPEIHKEVDSAELSPAEIAKGTKGRRYLKGFIPMLRLKERNEKESSQLQMRQRISMFMICLLRLFERKKKPAKAAASQSAAVQEEAKVEHSGLISS
ncbi:hypothetical protein R1flu_013325 [Riccia fluitans]|uniref:Uncharacterized protein n=1 Tax=Riccia fluitans TaxID=41844 RepID=A0ABD1YCX8_9MARC